MVIVSFPVYASRLFESQVDVAQRIPKVVLKQG